MSVCLYACSYFSCGYDYHSTSSGLFFLTYFTVVLLQNFTEAYDLNVDPYQLNNLAPSLSSTIEKMYMSWLDHLMFCSGHSCQLHWCRCQKQPLVSVKLFPLLQFAKLFYNNYASIIIACNINISPWNYYICAVYSLLILILNSGVNVGRAIFANCNKLCTCDRMKIVWLCNLITNGGL
jgi:hypothetical protein